MAASTQCCTGRMAAQPSGPSGHLARSQAAKHPPRQAHISPRLNRHPNPKRGVEALGPKSQTATTRARLQLHPCITLHLCLAAQLGSCSGIKVGALPTAAPGVGPPLPHRAGLRTAKPSGEWTCPSRGYGPQPKHTCPAHLRPTVKRSFHRACKRALEHGETAYKGRTLKPQHLSQDQVQKARAAISRRRGPSTTTQVQTRPHTGRQRVLVWNCGGLAYQDFLYWLTLQAAPPEIIIIVETRLAHHMEHATDAYFLMHSAKQHAGILIMVHKSVAPLNRIAWRVIEPGRVVHVRVYGTRGHLNIIGYYEQAWQPQSPSACLQERCRIQAQLEHVLTECSTRQMMLLGGDFNTDLVPMHPYVGTALPPTASQARHRQRDGPAL